MPDKIGAVLSRDACIALVLMLAAVTATKSHAQGENDHLIVPWKRIGPIALGMNATELVKILGTPRYITPGTVEVYDWADLSATMTKDKLWVTQICAYGSDYATAEGIHPGSADSAVATLLQPPRFSRTFNGFWRFKYTDMYWPGLLISVHLKGYVPNHVVWKICVNHSAAILE